AFADPVQRNAGLLEDLAERVEMVVDPFRLPTCVRENRAVEPIQRALCGHEREGGGLHAGAEAEQPHRGHAAALRASARRCSPSSVRRYTLSGWSSTRPCRTSSTTRNVAFVRCGPLLSGLVPMAWPFGWRTTGPSLMASRVLRRVRVRYSSPGWSAGVA